MNMCDLILRKEKWWEILKGENIDVVFDCVGGYESWKNSSKVLHKKGNYVTIVGDYEYGKSMGFGGLIVRGFSGLKRKFMSLFNNPGYYDFLMDNKKGLNELLQMLSKDQIELKLDDETPHNLSNYKEMMSKSMKHKAHGKLILNMDRKYYNKDNENDTNTNDDNKSNDIENKESKNDESKINDVNNEDNNNNDNNIDVNNNDNTNNDESKDIDKPIENESNPNDNNNENQTKNNENNDDKND